MPTFKQTAESYRIIQFHMAKLERALIKAEVGKIMDSSQLPYSEFSPFKSFNELAERIDARFEKAMVKAMRGAIKKGEI